MIQIKAVLVFAGIVIFVTDLIYCELSPDLGPSGPTMETCETYTCSENATCKDDDGYISCFCKFGKVGENCDIDNPCVERKDGCPAGSLCYGDCKPNVICEGATGFAHCRGCVAGWTGLHCEKKIHQCEEIADPCSNGGKCVDTNENIQCICQSGWVGKTCSCKQGSECDIEEIKDESGENNEEKGKEETKSDTSKSGTESNLAYSVTVLTLSIILYYNA